MKWKLGLYQWALSVLSIVTLQGTTIVVITSSPHSSLFLLRRLLFSLYKSHMNATIVIMYSITLHPCVICRYTLHCISNIMMSCITQHMSVPHVCPGRKLTSILSCESLVFGTFACSCISLHISNTLAVWFSGYFTPPISGTFWRIKRCSVQGPRADSWGSPEHWGMRIYWATEPKCNRQSELLRCPCSIHAP